MLNLNQHKVELDKNGFSIIENCFDDDVLEEISNFIEKNNFNFSERQLFNKYPELQEIIFENHSFRKLFTSICDESYFLSKAIYFNKSPKSNWFVGYHQDLSIGVKNKVEVEQYHSWTTKKEQLGVIPPINILENTITFRIHLDKTDATNGVLKVISKSHKKGMIRVDNDFDALKEGEEVTCNLDNGGIMIMKPLLLHSSQKSISEKNRRVLHLEFCNREIPMEWLEKKQLNFKKYEEN